MATGKQRIEWEIKLKDLATQILKELGTNVQKETKKADSAFKKMGKAVGGAIVKFAKLAAAALGVGSALMVMHAAWGKIKQGIKDAIEFSKAMSEVSTISEEAAENLGYVSHQVLDLSTKFGLLETVASKALYQIISAGVTDVTDAFTLLDGAVVLSKGGLADLVTTVDLLTNTINAYGFAVEEVEHINNVFFETVRLGKTTIPEMADSLGVATPIAAAMGVELEELTAMLATLTKGGVDTTTAVIYLRQAMVSVLRPSQDAQKIMAKNGIEFSHAKIKADGFIGILQELKDKLGDNIEAWQEFFPNVRAFIPVLALAGKQFQEFQSILADISRDTLDLAAPAIKALQRVMLSAGEKVSVMGNAARQGMMQLGMGIIEGMTGPITTMEELSAAAMMIRDSIGGLTPLVNLFIGSLLYAASIIPEVISLIVQVLKATGKLAPGATAELEKMIAGMSHLGDVAKDMGRAMMSGNATVTESLARLVEAQKERSRMIVEDALLTRKGLDASALVIEQLGDEKKTVTALTDAYHGAREHLQRQAQDIEGSYLPQSKQWTAALAKANEGLEEFVSTSDISVRSLAQVFGEGSHFGQLLQGAVDAGHTTLAQAAPMLGDDAATIVKAIMAQIAQLEKDAPLVFARFKSEMGRELGPLPDEIIRAMDVGDFEDMLATELFRSGKGLSNIYTQIKSIPNLIGDAVKAGKVPERTGQTIAALFEAGGVDWAKDVYKHLSESMDKVGEDPLLSPAAIKHLQANIAAAMREVAKVGGPELAKAIEEATLGAGAADLTPQQIAAAEELGLLREDALGQISATTLELERLGFMHAKTAEAQIAAIEQQTIQELALLELRRQLPADADDALTSGAGGEFERLVKAVKEGEDIQIAAIEAVEEKRKESAKKAGKTERDKLRKLAKKNREVGLEIQRDWGVFGIKSAKDFASPIGLAVTALAGEMKINLEETADLFGTDLAEKIGGSLGQLAGHFEEVPAFALSALEEIIEGSEAQLEAMASINVLADSELGPKFTDKQMEDLRLMIDNVKELALAEKEAAVAAVAHQEALKGYADISAQMVADANKEELAQLALQRAYADVFETRRQNALAEMEFQLRMEEVYADVFETRKRQAQEETEFQLQLGRTYADVIQARIDDTGELVVAEMEAERALREFLAAGEDTYPVWKQMRMGAAQFMQKAKSMDEALADLTEGALNEFTSGLTDAITAWADGSKTAEEAFDDFAVAFAIAVGQMIVQMLVMAAVVAALRLLGVPIPASMMPIETAADGAVFQGGLGTPVPLATGGVVPGGLGRALPVHGYADGGVITGGLQGVNGAFGGVDRALPVKGYADGGVITGGLQGVKGAFGGVEPLAIGGVVTGGLGRALPVKGYANGGPIVTGPHLALIGEGKQNEAVVPLPDGRSIPVDMRGGGTEVNISITTVDARGIDELLVDRQETLRAIIRQAMTEDRSFRSTMRGA